MEEATRNKITKAVRGALDLPEWATHAEVHCGYEWQIPGHVLGVSLTYIRPDGQAGGRSYREKIARDFYETEGEPGCVAFAKKAGEAFKDFVPPPA
jgi:hypothetical protein